MTAEIAQDRFCVHCHARVAACRKVPDEPIVHACSPTSLCPYVPESHSPACLWAKSVSVFAEEDEE